MKTSVFLILMLCNATVRAELPSGMQVYVDKVERYRSQSIQQYGDTRWNREVDDAKRKEAKKKVALAKKIHTLDYPDILWAPPCRAIQRSATWARSTAQR
jgi:hypothetical protein